ncbi:tetraspanin Pls1 family [Ramaria rubella]|nr:tetraspanin Pls1 family [Ramaria rubella]
MSSKKLLGFWAFFDICLLAAGVIAVVFSIIWKSPNNVLRHLVFTDTYVTAGLVLGSLLLFSFVVSLGAIIQPNHVIRPLTILNWFLILDMFAAVAVGTIIWWATLKERQNFSIAFDAVTDQARLVIQNDLQCCGYWFNNETNLIVNQGFCATANNATPCVGPVTDFADVTLNDIFTSIYGFVAVIIGFFLATLCVIKTRQEVERFKRIDAKRGGRGFV